MDGTSKKTGWNTEKFNLGLMEGLGFLFIIAFVFVPFIGVVIAFLNYRPGWALSDCKFVGLKNFIDMFSGVNEFPMALRNTLALGILGILVSWVPVLFAVMLNEVRNKPFQRVIQTTSAFPNFLSWIIVYSLAVGFFAQEDGLVNRILFNLGLIERPTSVLTNAGFAWVFQTLLGLWKGTGWGAIVYIAAIAGLDPNLYEAARIDGAGRFRCIWHITLPGIVPTYLVLLMLRVASILSTGFEQYYVFHNPMIHMYIEVIDTYVYRTGITLGDFPMATAVGLMKSLVSIALLFSFNLISDKLFKRKII
jgi:ABC-type polysaccharide transport system permease subunit